MKVIYNNIIPLPGFIAINLFGVLFVRNGVILTDRIVNHEKIHTAQMKELWYINFYLIYILEWIVKLFVYGKDSYRNIRFEREAYDNGDNLDYLKTRKKFSWKKRYSLRH